MIGITNHYPHHPRRWKFLGNHRWLSICCARLKPSSTSRRTPERPNCWGLSPTEWWFTPKKFMEWPLKYPKKMVIKWFTDGDLPNEWKKVVISPRKTAEATHPTPIGISSAKSTSWPAGLPTKMEITGTLATELCHTSPTWNDESCLDDSTQWPRIIVVLSICLKKKLSSADHIAMESSLSVPTFQGLLFLTGAKRREWMGCWGLLGLLGVAGMIITSDYGSFPQIPCV